MRKPDRPKSGVIFRCAIYTRKSSDGTIERVGAHADQQAFPLRFHTSNGNNDGCVSAYRPRRPLFLATALTGCV